jgi:hypothetical protein
MHRRNFIKAATLTVAMAAAGLTSLSAFAADTIKVGILHSLSGTMAISETALNPSLTRYAPISLFYPHRHPASPAKPLDFG